MLWNWAIAMSHPAVCLLVKTTFATVTKEMNGQACLAAVVSFWPLNVAALLLVGSVTRRLSDCSRLSDRHQHHRVRQLCKLCSLHGARPMAALLHNLHNNNTPLVSYTTSTFTPSVMQSWKCLSTTMPICISNLFLLGGGFLQSPKCPRLWSATGTVTVDQETWKKVCLTRLTCLLTWYHWPGTGLGGA